MRLVNDILYNMKRHMRNNCVIDITFPTVLFWLWEHVFFSIASALVYSSQCLQFDYVFFNSLVRLVCFFLYIPVMVFSFFCIPRVHHLVVLLPRKAGRWWPSVCSVHILTH